MSSVESLQPLPADSNGPRPNRLIHEKSPYLLQHAHNPVDWYPWNEEAFAKAKREDKPVFLSIGYSTCYWCHVMEQESFDNAEIAQLMRETVVAIKVDREERPDIDALYMAAVQAMSGSGGWPMSVFLTPEGQPFWGGTYFPPEDRGGYPGFKTILHSMAQAWKSRRAELLHSSQSLTQAIQASAGAPSSTQLSAAILDTAVAQFAEHYDSLHGGFGPAPKFPRSHSLSFLLRVYSRNKDPKVLAMVEATLDAMDRGGIHDHLGGGFHRYSTDPQWLVPHFEKMLYDQALLARAYLEAYQVTGKSRYAEVARDIFEYVLEDMQDPQGAFRSAEDAGKVGKEGEYYVWTLKEIEEILDPLDAALFNRFYGVRPEGNFENKTTILSIPQPLEAFAKQQGASLEQLRQRLKASRAKLLAAREKRLRPYRDDKILTDWNGLMIGALAYGAKTLNEPRYAQAAEEAADFVLKRLQHEGRLFHRYRNGEAAISAFLDDYAFLSWGLFDLYESTFEVRWLSFAKRLTKEMVRLFWDHQNGGFFLSGEQNERLIAKTKELYDGALPSGNSVAALNLIRLGILTMDPELKDYAQRQFQAFSVPVGQFPQGFPQFLIALDFWFGPSREIVIAATQSMPETQAMLRVVQERFLPRTVLAFRPKDGSPALEALLPFIQAQKPFQGKPTAYVCKNYVCNLPTTDLTKLAALLDAP
ncbi:MAG: thioredoxin domain-containing protein [Candidatus Omnitrophica bacterium]|nr:thioredoxin domain-containing protein [Candidatus Omnitrophota bacterium]